MVGSSENSLRMVSVGSVSSISSLTGPGHNRDEVYSRTESGPNVLWGGARY